MDDADDLREKLKDLVARWIAADEAERAEMPGARNGSTLQTDTSVTIRPLMLALAQRVSHI